MSISTRKKIASSKSIVMVAMVAILGLAIAVGALTVFALSQVEFNSSVKISYQAIDIAGKVTMYAKAASKESNYTATPADDKIGEFVFTPTTDTTETPAEINMEGIELDSTHNALYLHYHFENTGTRAYTAVLNYALTDIIVNQNMTLEYSENGTTYKNANSGLVVPGKGTKDYFVKISVTDLAFNADFEGMFTWQLNECDDSLTAMEEISLSATEFTVIDEAANTYSARYNGQDISIKGDVAGQANDGIENIWYVPGRVGSGRVVSVVPGEFDLENYSPVHPLPNNTKVVIATGVTEIAASAFRCEKGLVEITIPNTVTNLGAFAFEECSELIEVTIPNGITIIESYLFLSCGNLKNVKLPNTVIKISQGAFVLCTSLTEINIPDSVVVIGSFAFGNSGLTKIEIPNSVTTLEGESIFAGCDNLTNITFGKGIKSIVPMMFYGCNALEEVTISDNIEWIGPMAFENCVNLKTVFIKAGVVSISFAFWGCTNLTDVYFEDATGWKADGALIAEDLSNSKTAAICLKENYSSSDWTK